MKLAVYARALGTESGGRGVAAHDLVVALGRVRRDWKIHLFASADPGWPGVTFHQARGGNAISDAWLSLRGVGAALQRLRPDALWCVTHLVPVGVPSNLPVVVTLHDVVWRDHPGTMDRMHRLAAAFGEKGLARAARIVCDSHFTRSRLAHFWPHLSPRARVLHLAPSARIVGAPVETLGISGSVVANVGTLEPRKNLDVLVRAMADLPDAVLCQYGARGWRVGAAAERWRRLPNVKLLGYGDDQSVAALYRTAAVAAFPSIYEGFHLPPLEAMALGCPVVASDIPVHREVLGTSAVFVPPSDAPALAAALKYVVGSPVERKRLVAAGLEHASRYSWEATAEGLAGVLVEAATENAGTFQRRLS